MPVKGYGMAAADEVLNRVRVLQRDELSQSLCRFANGTPVSLDRSIIVSRMSSHARG
jgi:hypothetical protein